MQWIVWVIVSSFRCMKIFLKVLIILIVVAIVSSCIRTGIMKDVPVIYARPDKVVSVSVDTTLKCTFEEAMHCYDIQIAGDSILVLYDQANDNDPYHFKAYSANTFEYLGAFVRKGRGPGEMIVPWISNASGRYLYCEDNQSPVAYMIDAVESVISGQACVKERFDVPSDVIYWLPLSESVQFVMQTEGKEMILRTIDKDGNVLRTYTPFAGIDSERSLTYFSSIFGDRGNGREVVEVMMFLPQINIIDTESGSIQSVAVDRSYMKWKRIFGSMINMDMMNYYYGATTTPEYIVAAYRHLPLKEIGKPGYGTSIHVFDWDGDFLYDIRVNEDIGQMTYDSIHNRLYCLDVQGRVIRYDLSEIL